MDKLVLGEGSLFVFQDTDGNITLSAEVGRDIGVAIGQASGKCFNLVISNKENDKIVHVTFQLKRENK